MKPFLITISALILASLLLGLAPPARAGTVGDPFTGVPIVINGTPGAVTQWEAENFDKGGEGVAFHDPHSCSAPPTGTTCSCPPNAYRPDGVNVCTAGAVTHISYDDAGLWVGYTIQVSTVGNYTMELLVAIGSAACCDAATYHVELDGVPVTKTIALGPKLTAGWQAYEWRGKSELIGMVPGIHHLRIVVDKGWFNWDSIRMKFSAGIEWQQVPVWKTYD